MYWFVLTISPLVLILSGYVDSRVQAFALRLDTYYWLSTAFGVLWSVAAIWFLMFAVYALFPSAGVRLRPAMAGALVAAILLEIGKRTMGLYLQNAISLSQLYGSLGLIPLFMFWVYLMWLAVLFGLQVSSTLQHLRGRQLAELERQQSLTAMVDPSVVIVIMQEIASQFAGGKSTDVSEAARVAGVPETVAERILESLVDAGLVCRLAEPESALTLSRPPEQIKIDDLLAIGQQLAGQDADDEATSRLLATLKRAQREAGGNMTLAALVA
jgi:membrane protein